MKHKKILEADSTTDNIEISEQRYKQMFQANERIFEAIYNSFASCARFSFYQTAYPMFPQVKRFNYKLENNKIEKAFRKKMNK